MYRYTTEKCTDVPYFAGYGMSRQVAVQTFSVVKSVVYSNSVVSAHDAVGDVHY